MCPFLFSTIQRAGSLLGKRSYPGGAGGPPTTDQLGPDPVIGSDLRKERDSGAQRLVSVLISHLQTTSLFLISLAKSHPHSTFWGPKVPSLPFPHSRGLILCSRAPDRQLLATRPHGNEWIEAVLLGIEWPKTPSCLLTPPRDVGYTFCSPPTSAGL